MRALLFDIDGTLMDTFEAILEAMNEAVAQLGLEPLRAKELRPLIGRDIATQMVRLRGLEGPQVHRIRDIYYERFVDRVKKGVRLYPGVSEFFNSLSGYSVGTISTRRREVARLMLEKTGLLQYFTEVTGGDMVSRPKPNPDLVHLACGALGVPPEESVVIGDSPVDILAGRAAGALTVAVTYGYGDREEILAASPHATVDSFRELRGVLSRLPSAV